MATYKYAQQPRNQIDGSCSDAQKAARRGALDGDGKASADRRPGFTRPEVQIGFKPVGRKAIEKTAGGWECNQDGSIWDSRAKCFQNCRKAGLGGPAIVDCIGTEEEVKVTQTVRGTVDFSQETYGLVWATGCAEGKRWNKQIRDHEGKHRSDNTQIVKEWREKNRDRTFTGTGSDETKATDDLKRRMTEAADKERNELLDKMATKGEEFHGTPEGAKAVLDCSKCQ